MHERDRSILYLNGENSLYKRHSLKTKASQWEGGKFNGRGFMIPLGEMIFDGYF